MLNRLVTPFLLVLVVVGGVLALLTPDYQATAEVRTNSAAATATVDGQATGLVGDPAALADVLGTDLDLIQGARVEVRTGDRTVEVVAHHQDPRFAQAVASTVAARAAAGESDVEHIELAAPPAQPDGPSRLVLLGVGVVFALAVSLALAALTDRWRR